MHIHLVRLMVLSIAVTTIGGCADLPIISEPVTEGSRPPESKPTLKPNPKPVDNLPPEVLNGLSFRNTRLYGLFTGHPYDSTVPIERQFPRVAITVIDTPRTRVKKTSSPQHRVLCWKLRAKIWLSERSFQNVESFYWCSPNDAAPTNVPLRAANEWFYGSSPAKNTGSQRTDEAVPPETPLPSDLPHLRLWDGGRLSASEIDGYMLVSILYFMHFDWTNKEDHRVWVVEFVEARW